MPSVDPIKALTKKRDAAWRDFYSAVRSERSHRHDLTLLMEQWIYYDRKLKALLRCALSHPVKEGKHNGQP